MKEKDKWKKEQYLEKVRKIGERKRGREADS